jgi:hypothetical protein
VPDLPQRKILVTSDLEVDAIDLDDGRVFCAAPYIRKSKVLYALIQPMFF